MLAAAAASVRRVADWKSKDACSVAHFERVCERALEARARSSFSKFSWVRAGALGVGVVAVVARDLEGVDLGFEGGAIIVDERVGCVVCFVREVNEIIQVT